MATKPTRTESKMILEVRRWRRAAYDADKSLTPAARAARAVELAARYGLPLGPRSGENSGKEQSSRP